MCKNHKGKFYNHLDFVREIKEIMICKMCTYPPVMGIMPHTSVRHLQEL
jgi:hypothetical protein